MNLFAVRLPFALYGVLAVLGIYLLFRELFYTDENREKWALLAAFLLAVSPWHIHYSRIAFESGLALTLLIFALYFFYHYLRLSKLSSLLLSAMLAVLSIYAYHSSKVVTPLLFLVLFLGNIAFFKTKFKHLLIAGFVALVALAPFLQDAFFANGLTRANSTVFSQGLGIVDLLKTLVVNFLSYFSLNYLILGENLGNFRHGDGKFGIIEPISLSLIIFYLIFRKTKTSDKKLFSLSILITLVGLLPAIISEGLSSSNRSLLALPGIILLVVLAIRSIFNSLRENKKIFLSILVVLYLGLLTTYQKNYYESYASRSTDDFMDGYLETFSYLRALDRSNINQIVFTTDYQQAYIYALFAFEVSPIAYQGGILNLFFFADKIDQADLDRKNSIVVASKFDRMGERKADKIIEGSDGVGRFFIYLPL
jgi:4-amino-4-deoxy-L-arabinose transferase-like glycosyltransferase